jgi:hypothetical protein
MSLPYAAVEVVNSNNTRFTNATPGDLTIFTKDTTQKIHFGTHTGASSTMTLSDTKVEIPNVLNLKGILSHNGQTIIDANGNIIGMVEPLPIAGGTMQGQIKGLGTDTVSTPAYSWSNDSNTGFYNKQAGVIGITCNGVEVAAFSNQGATYAFNTQTKGIRLSN